MLAIPSYAGAETGSVTAIKSKSVSHNLMDSIVNILYKVNFCLDVQTPTSADINYHDSTLSVKQACRANSNDYIKTHLIGIDIFGIDIVSIGRYYEDDRIVILSAVEDAYFHYSWIKKNILPPYASTTNTEDLKTIILFLADKESAGNLRKNLTRALKQTTD
jgi:hypothetical protein